jgi:hypothetical protein
METAWIGLDADCLLGASVIEPKPVQPATSDQLPLQPSAKWRASNVLALIVAFAVLVMMSILATLTNNSKIAIHSQWHGPSKF